ncbi:hypothetical protein HDU78_005972 [Chytriomyces hyalinus]|nr:hypothetical protein HDU78_005972 [Chytriomyces hyalinus]
MFSSGTDNNNPNTSTYSTKNPNTGFSSTENPKLPSAPIDSINLQTSQPPQNVPSSSDIGGSTGHSSQPSAQGQQPSVSQGLYDAGSRTAQDMGLKQQDQGSSMYDTGVRKVKEMSGQQDQGSSMYDTGVRKVKEMTGQQQQGSPMQGMYDTGNRAAQDMGLKQQDQGSTTTTTTQGIFGTGNSGAESAGGSQQQPSMMSKMEHGAKKLFGQE